MINLFWFVGLPILITTALYLLKKLKSKIYYIIFQCLFLVFAIDGFIFVRQNGAVHHILGNYTVGIGIGLQYDLLSSAFILLNIFLFTCFVIFNIHKHYMNRLFLFLFLILEGLINGLFLTNDLFNIYVLLELSTVVVSILIMFKKDRQSMYDGLIYLLTNIVSMTFYLLGIGYLYKIFGTLDITLIATYIPLVQNTTELILPYCLIITAVSLKSAVMPLFSWLPRAHGTPSAPSIVSAVLSGLYIKTGIFLFIRFQEVFSPLIDTHSLFIVFGILTAAIGFLFALSQTDLKLILAYSTVSQVGLMIIGLSMDNQYGYYGGIYHIFSHAIFKSVLFLTAGMIIERYETRDIRKISGVFKSMPFVSLVSIIAILSVTGAPLFNGSLSKYFIQKGAKPIILTNFIRLISLGTILYFTKYSTIFLGNSTLKKEKPRFNQIIALSALSLTCILGGIFGTNILALFFNFHGTVSLTAYFNKSIIYVLFVIIGILFYRYLYNRLSLFTYIRRLEFSFNQVIFSLVLFLMFLFGYLHI